MATTPPHAHNDRAAQHLTTRLDVPENEPTSMDWGANSMDLRKSNRSALANSGDYDRRQLVQRLVFEELQAHGRRKSTSAAASHDARMSMIEQAQSLSTAFLLETRGSERQSGARGPTLTRKEEKQLRKSVARAIRSEEKQQKKLEKLNKKRAKQYERANEFFDMRANADASYFHTSSGLSDSYNGMRMRANSLDSSVALLGSSNASVRSGSKPPRMDFLFFPGSSTDGSNTFNDLEFGRRRYRRHSSASRTDSARGTSASQDAYKYNDLEQIKINPTLVRNMPRPFEPRIQRAQHVIV